MPTYEYKCSDCGYDYEQFQSITAKAIRKCPNCGKNTLKRLIGCGAGLIFKGSGFYETDYRSDSYNKAAKAEQDKSAGTKDSDSAGSAGKSGNADKSKAVTTVKTGDVNKAPEKSR